MTDTAKQIIEIAGDKTLSFGCFIEGYSDSNRKDTGIMRFVINEEEKDYQPRRMHVNSEERSFMMPDEGRDYKIIGHPIHVGHLMKLSFEKPKGIILEKIITRFNNNLHLYSQDCLSWDEETNQLILDYLLTVKGEEGYYFI